MKALVFGAGNIGRGFIGQILKENHYELIFADINEQLIDEINRKRSYKVYFADEDKRPIEITDIVGVHNIKEPQRLKEAIHEVDLITTAVGINIVPIIAQTILEGIKERLSKESIKPLNIIACENSIGATEVLKKSLFLHLNEEERMKAEEYIGFPNSAVDRIVPIQSNENLLDVMVEPYYEWIIEADKINKSLDLIKGVQYKKDLKSYIERKLFTVNTGHATTAYLGDFFGYKTINEAINDDEILDRVLRTLSETSDYLVSNFKFSIEEQRKYVDAIINRFKNPYISDDISRVARSPIRKISPNDRFIYPAKKLLNIGKMPYNLAKTLSYVLKYSNEEDEESVELNDYLNEYGVSKTLEKYCDLEEGSILAQLIEENYGKLERFPSTI